MAELKTTETPAVEAAGYAAPRAASKAKWLTFEYTLAMASVTLATLLSVGLVSLLASFWSSKNTASLATFFSMTTANFLAVGVLSVIFAVLAFVLFSRVTRAVAERTGYTSRLVYKLATYGSLFVLVLAALPLVASLVSVLISSVLLIGAGDAGKVYGTMYLGTFLPALVGLLIIAAVIFFVGKIVCGYNKSRMLSVVLLVITGVITAALAITLAVQAHNKPEVKKPLFKYNSSQNYFLD